MLKLVEIGLLVSEEAENVQMLTHDGRRRT
jgi:hypothetical protein